MVIGSRKLKEPSKNTQESKRDKEEVNKPRKPEE